MLSSNEVEDLRQQIDETDRLLLQLIEKRSQLALAIGKIKGRDAKGFDGFYRPSREMQVLRKIAGQSGGIFPKASLMAIWREIISSVLQLQSPYSVAIREDNKNPNFAALARNEFGAMTRFTFFSSSAQILAALSGNKAQLGLLPMPGQGEDGGWWLSLHAPFHVLARLRAFDGREAGEALLVGQAALEPTGDDQTLIVVSCDQELSRMTLCSAIRGMGFQTSPLDAIERDGRNHYLIQFEGFLSPDDQRLNDLANKLPIEARWIGAYATPF